MPRHTSANIESEILPIRLPGILVALAPRSLDSDQGAGRKPEKEP